MSCPPRVRVAALTIALAMAGTGCGDSRPTGPDAVPARLDIASGDDQTGVVGAQLEEALVVKVLDARGRPVRNQLINFRVTAGGGSVFAGSALSNDAGIARERWTLGTQAGQPQAVEARVVDSRTGEPLVLASFDATAVAGTPVSMTPVAGLGQSAGPLGAVPIRPAVRLVDGYDNPVPNIPVTFAVTGDAGSATGVEVSTDAQGVATVGSWTLGSRVGSNTLTATASGMAAVFTATTMPGAPDRLVKEAGDAQSAVVSTATDVAPVVALLDAHGNGIPGVPVTFAAGSGGATTVTSTATDADGRARAGSWTLGTTAGTQSLTAAAPSLTAVFTAVARADAPARFEKLRGDAQQAYLGQSVAVPPAVRLSDRFGNPIADAAVTFTVTAGGGSVTGANQLTGGDGVAGAESWTVGATRGLQLLAASTGTFATTFTATAMSRDPQRIVPNFAVPYWAGDTVVPSVKVVDDAGAPVPDVVVTFRLGVSTQSATLVGPVDTTDNAGFAHAERWTVSNLGTYRLIVSAPGLPELEIVASVNTGGETTHFSIEKWGTTIPTSQVGGFFGYWKVEPRDAFWNRGHGVGRILATSSDALGTHSAREFDVGDSYALVPWAAGCAIGTQTLTIMDATDSLPRSSRSFTVSAGPPDKLVKVAGDSQSAPAGSTLPERLVVRVEDKCGNALKNVTVQFVRPTPSGTVAESVVTGTDGLATMTGWVLPNTAGTYSATFGFAGFGASGSFTATATAPPE